MGERGRRGKGRIEGGCERADDQGVARKGKGRGNLQRVLSAMRCAIPLDWLVPFLSATPR